MSSLCHLILHMCNNLPPLLITVLLFISLLVSSEVCSKEHGYLYCGAHVSPGSSASIGFPTASRANAPLSLFSLLFPFYPQSLSHNEMLNPCLSLSKHYTKVLDFSLLLSTWIQPVEHNFHMWQVPIQTTTADVLQITHCAILKGPLYPEGKLLHIISPLCIWHVTDVPND